MSYDDQGCMKDTEIKNRLLLQNKGKRKLRSQI